MKITVAHMGRLAQIAKPMLEDLGLDVVLPPRPSQATLAFGVKHSPEFACLPLKLNIGIFADAAKTGADTVLMAGGLGPCRFGYYAEVERLILDELGFNLKMVILEPPKGRFQEFYRSLRSLVPNRSPKQILAALIFTLEKNRILDELDGIVKRVSAAEITQGTAEAAFNRAAAKVLASGSYRELHSVAQRAKRELEAIPKDPSLVRCTIATVGEIYCVLEPFVNMDLERRLNRFRVEVIQTVTLSHWIGENLTLNPVKRNRYRRRLLKDASGYLGHWVGGEGLETVANTAMHGRIGTDGVIQIAPFTCMPEIVGQSILPKVSKELDIPHMSFFFDEHASETGLETRLEAFVDLLSMRRKKLRSASSY